MLHGSYMELETVVDAKNKKTFQPKTPFKRFYLKKIYISIHVCVHTFINMHGKVYVILVAAVTIHAYMPTNVTCT